MGYSLEEEMHGYNFIEYAELGKPRYLILGLPDAGIIGPIVASHMVKSLGMKDVIGIESYTYIPPAAIIKEGSIKYPMRIYVKDDISVLVTDISPVPSGIVPLASAIVEFARKRGFEYLIGISGIGNPSRAEIEKPNVYWLATTHDSSKLVEKISSEVKLFPDGIIVGPYAVILKESAKRRVNSLLLLADAFIEIPDPEAAAEITKVISKIINVEIDVSQLLQEAETLRLRLQGLAKETKNTLARVGKGYEYRTPLIYS
ncbi:MAG: PAC2 family protein [Caldisphaeraceae archaeon]|nr:PAC2 family protein [Caldisphaeraceae archaeon]MEB3691768.1 PAC2 family protein [Caldisphaeraceae archaeon]MEB3797825.1 PAC2 family protein [Caldisphaeraceae archaeon]